MPIAARSRSSSGRGTGDHGSSAHRLSTAFERDQLVEHPAVGSFRRRHGATLAADHDSAARYATSDTAVERGTHANGTLRGHDSPRAPAWRDRLREPRYSSRSCSENELVRDRIRGPEPRIPSDSWGKILSTHAAALLRASRPYAWSLWGATSVTRPYAAHLRVQATPTGTVRLVTLGSCCRLRPGEVLPDREAGRRMWRPTIAPPEHRAWCRHPASIFEHAPVGVSKDEPQH